MMRYVLLAFLGLGASVARAEGMLDDGGATIKFNKLFIHADPTSDELTEVPIQGEDQTRDNYFNFAHCMCSQAVLSQPIAGFKASDFEWELTVEGFTVADDQTLQIWTGTSCSDPLLRPMQCTQVATTGTVNTINSNNGTRVNIPIFNLMAPGMMQAGCPEIQQDQITWVLADGVPRNGDLDYSVSQTIKVDTQPPPQPTNFSAVGAENAIDISWTAPTDASDVAYYQAMCAVMSSGAPGKTAGRPPARYQTGKQLCGTTDDPFFAMATVEGGVEQDDAGGTLDEPDGWRQADPMFLCAETSASTATGIRIDGLKNGTAYIIAVLVVDRAGNVQGTTFSNGVVPQPATDFWEDIHDQGSGVEGGFCLLAQTYGDNNPLTNTLRAFRDNTLADTAYGRWLIDVYYGTIGALDLHGSLALRIVAGVLLLPLVVLALLWHLLTLPGLIALATLLVLIRRRRFARLRLAAGATTIALVAFMPARAHAQTPYWENHEFANPEAELPPGDPMRIRWHAGIRLGPFTPGIDDQINMPVGKFAGPFEQMFGGSSILPMLDVDYFLWRGFGQLGVGASLGYIGKKAHAWQFGSDPADPKRPRAAGDDNKFRLFPFSVNAVYRFTYLDDEYGIPIVPYARGGLAYYVWWITAPNGDFATSCVGPNTGAMCEKTTAVGASLGVVGSVGLAIRAERVDESAARSMRESGIEHAGFYAEYSIGKVDGFGSDKKLSVGDATWFAGVDFEF